LHGKVGVDMSDKYERVLDYLSQNDGWVSANELADTLGVTTRSVRSYVTAAKAAAQPLQIIAASTSGYRINLEAYAQFLARDRNRDAHPDTPRERVHHLARRLTEAPQGLDIYSLAESLHVSESTIEADLRKVKSLGEQAGLRLTRSGSVVSLSGSERDYRRLLSGLFRAAGAHGFLELDYISEEFPHGDLSGFKTGLIAMLERQGYFVNEHGVNSVLLHVAIAVERAASDNSLGVSSSVNGDMPEALSALIREHFHVSLSTEDLDYLTTLLTTRVITPGQNRPVAEVVEQYVDPENLATVRRVIAQVATEYLVDLDDEALVMRLSLHLGNLMARANDNSYSRNPLGRSIKTSYPMIYDLAVFIASLIQRERDIVINDDEISYIALHLGSYLERQSRREQRLTAAIVVPGYYDMHQVLRDKIESVLGDEISIEVVVTRTDIDWNDFSTDLILTTITDPTFADNVVAIQPFFTDNDVDTVRAAISRNRKHRRRSQIKDDLLVYFDESLFLRNVTADSEADLIRTLGDLMMRKGVIDDSYVAGAIERELLSSTAFTDTLAVPHAMAMTAKRTSIAIAVNETPMAWGENRVNVIALIAFSAEGRASFQTVFDQFVEVFSERGRVLNLIRNSDDFGSFIEELVHVIEE
jgi:lichenan operon transcriptional antiterminator